MKTTTKLECKFIIKGAELNEPIFSALVDWCDFNHLNIKRFILNEGRRYLKDGGNYNDIVKKGLSKVVGKKYQDIMPALQRIQGCQDCVFNYLYKISGACNNLYKKKEMFETTSFLQPKSPIK